MPTTKVPATALFILALCFVLSVIGRGVGESFTVFLLPISQHFGWDRSEVISIYSIAALVGGIASPFVGRLFDRSGPSIVYCFGLLMLGCAFFAAAFANKLWQFQISLGLCIGLGMSCIGIVPNSIMLGRWFGRKLPTAMAIVYSAMGGGVLVLVPTSQLLIDHFGWQKSYEIFGYGAVLLIAGLLMLPWRTLAGGSPAIMGKTKHDLMDDGWTLLAALRHHAFWALFFTFFFTALGMYAVSAQVVAYLVDVGFPPLQAATAWGFSGVVLVIGMLSISWLDGLFGRLRSIILSYALSIIGIGMLWLLQTTPSVWLLAGFIASFGSTMGSRGPLITATALKIYRGKRVGTIFGTISIGSGLGAALGAWSGGFLHDFTGNYNALLAFALVSVILGMIPFLTVRLLRE